MNKKTDATNKQALTFVGRVSKPDDSTALLLGLLGFSATKLWNSALWYTKEQWEATGKIPSFAEVDKFMKASNNRWYKSLHAQSAQAVLEELWQSYKSWFALRKKGDPKAKPPGFRRKTTLSAVTLKKDSVRWDRETRIIRIGIPEAVYGHKYLYLPVQLPPEADIDPTHVQLSRLIYEKGEWQAHLVCDIPVPETKTGGHTLAIDLGMNVLSATACTDGTTALWSGGELSGMERYFEKEKSVCNDSRSRKSKALNSKRSRQRNHFLHSLTRTIVNDAHARGVTTIVIGDLKDMRTDKKGEVKDWGDSGNQGLHKWPYSKITGLIRYKAKLLGIGTEVVSEHYTSQDCSQCKTRRKASRVTRGRYACPTCGTIVHADVNGAINILQRYLPDVRMSWSSGCLAQPVVNRFAWRETTPRLHALPGKPRNSNRRAQVQEPGTWASFGATPASTNKPKELSC